MEVERTSPAISKDIAVAGLCNGKKVFPKLFWAAIQQANNFGGAAAVQSLLSIAFLNWYNKVYMHKAPPFQMFPVFPASAVPVPSDGTIENPSVSCQAALVGSWTS